MKNFERTVLQITGYLTAVLTLVCLGAVVLGYYHQVLIAVLFGILSGACFSEAQKLDRNKSNY